MTYLVTFYVIKSLLLTIPLYSSSYTIKLNPMKISQKIKLGLLVEMSFIAIPISMYKK